VDSPIAVLLAVARVTDDLDGTYADHRARVWVLDEYVDRTGLASPVEDARGILDMLRRHGMEWHQLAHAMGDRVHLSGEARQKSNKDLAAQIARLLTVPRDGLQPPIRIVKKSRGGRRDYVGTGARWIYQAMAAPGGWRVHPRCERVIDALNTWTGPGPDCDEKDPIDALRYGLEDLIWGGVKPAAVVVEAR